MTDALMHLQERLAREDRERLAFFALSETEQKKQQVRNYIKYKEDPWAFIRDCVWTLDQVDSVNPVKPAPSHLAYLKLLVLLWIKNKLCAVPKSRRMHASWTYIALYLHDTMFNTGRYNAFVSKKEDNAGELVSRAQFIFEHIPEWRIPRELLPKIKGGSMTKKPPVLEFEETHSKIQGFPQGADQLRQFTLSGILGDECAFWEDAEAFYSASKPTLDGGGRMTLISSRAPGFFKKIVFDKVSSKDYNFPEIPAGEVKRPMEGVELWKNPANKFLVIDLGYEADPAKRGEEWEKSIRESLPHWQFEMEYKKSWDAHQGKPVHADFKKDFHSVKGKLKIEAHLPFILGADFGLTPAITLSQLVGQQFRTFKEFIETDGSISKLAPVVWGWLKTNYPNWANDPQMILTYIDPAGLQRNQVDARTCAMELIKCGFKNVIPGPPGNNMAERRAGLEHFLTTVSKAGPGYLISESECPMTFAGLAGGFKYPESYTEIEPNSKPTPLKNSSSHPCEALEYSAWGAAKTLQTYGRDINLKPPQYGFKKGHSA